MPGFFIKFSIRQGFNDFGEGSNFSMKWAIFATSEFFLHESHENITTLQTLHRFLRAKSGRYLLYIIIKSCN